MKSDEIRQFLMGEFELDCPKIELLPSCKGPTKGVIQGSGYIKIGISNRFLLRMYIKEIASFDETFEKLKWEAGKLISDDYRYDLKAYALDGKTWCAENVLPDRSSGPNGSMIEARIPELWCEEFVPAANQNSSVQLYFNEEIRLPLNIVVKEEKTIGSKTVEQKLSVKIAEFDAVDASFQVEALEGYTVIRAKSLKRQLNGVFPSRIWEAFSFVTGYADSWSLMRLHSEGRCEYRIRPIAGNKKMSIVNPPISYVAQPMRVSVWNLYSRFLEHIAENTCDHVHPLSKKFFQILDAGRASPRVEALTLTVITEALLREEFEGVFPVDKKLVEELDRVARLVESEPTLDKKVRERVKGTLNAMKSPRAKDVLLRFKAAGLIESHLVSTYHKLRNKLAHGVDVTEADFQEFFNQTNSVLVLFYQLIFLLVEYRGEYTDYGTYNYPTKYFDAAL